MSPARSGKTTLSGRRRGQSSLPSYRYRDALDLDRAPDMMAAGPAASVYVEAPGEARVFLRAAPEFNDDPDGVLLFSDLNEDRVICPPPFIAMARNVLVTGFRTVLSEEGLFFNDDSAGGSELRRFLKDLSQPDPLNEETGLTLAKSPDVFAFRCGERRVERLPGTTVLLSSAEPANYGSWLFRVLPKLETLARAGVSLKVKYLVWAEVPTFQEFLQRLGIVDDQIVHHDPRNVVYSLEDVIVPSMRNNQAFLDAETLAFFARLRADLGGPSQPGKRIYISRLLQSENGSSRAMRNERELVERLISMNFEIVNPETLSVAEQVTIFSSAEMVVGPSGSGLFNVVFCHPGTKIVDIESEPHWIHAHRSLFASCGLRYGIFAGVAADRKFESHHKSWTVNIEALIARIEEFSRT